MNKFLLCLTITVGATLSCVAQPASDVAKEINKVKRDTAYIYAETTNKDLNEAHTGACAILEMKVGEWVRDQHPNETYDLCIVKAKEHSEMLETRRGNFFRVLAYVKKNDILPISDRSEVAVFDVTPPVEDVPSVEHNYQPIPSDATIDDGGYIHVPVVETTVITLNAEEERMKQITNFSDLEPYIKGLKNNGSIVAYGKYKTMPVDEDCHIFIYNQQGNILALLRKCGSVQFNLNTLQEDDVTNYKKCGAIWLQLN